MFSPGFLVFSLISIFVIGPLITYLSIKRKIYVQYVEENSESIKMLKHLNTKYVFNEFDESNRFNHTYDNANFYNNISCKDYLIYLVSLKTKEFINKINAVKANRILYNEYDKKVKEITIFGNYGNKETNLDKSKLISIENDIFNKLKLNPRLYYYVTIKLYCSKINGDVYDKKSQIFYYEEIMYIIQQVTNKSGKFYNEQDVWDAICRVERGKVSNKMRFSIYERDGYRCKRCGKKQEMNDLEIDHIFPISKGGKSTYDNLQTLCRRCNKLKGNSIDY